MRKINHIRLNFSLNGENPNAYLPSGISICIESGENKEKLFKNLEADCLKKNGETHLLQHASSLRKEFFNTTRHLFHDSGSLDEIVSNIMLPKVKSLGSPIQEKNLSVLDESLLPQRKPVLIIIDMDQASNCTHAFTWEASNILAAQARAVGITTLICFPTMESLTPAIIGNHIGEINFNFQKENITVFSFLKNLIFSKNRVDYKESASRKEKTIKL